MRLLAFYPYLPYPLDRGAHHRGFHLLRELARSHEVDLLALTENGEGPQARSVFLEFCRRVELVPFAHPPWQKFFPKRLSNPLPATVAHWTSPELRTRLARILAAERYDAVHVFDIILGQYLTGAAPKPPWVVDRTRVDLQYQLMERRRLTQSWCSRLLDLEKLIKLWRFERSVAAQCEMQVVCGQDDAAFLRRYISRSLPISVIPNGVDMEFFQPRDAWREDLDQRPTMLFCGAMDYNPNVDGLRWFFAEIHEPLLNAIPDLQLLIVGKDPVPEVQRYAERPGVLVTGAVSDVRPFYRRAWMQIVPLRIGGGTRLKIVESMAMGTPVLSTRIGAQGLGLTHDRDILLADSAPELVAEAIRAMQDARLRERLTRAGLATVRARLAWPTLGRQLAEVYSELEMRRRPTQRSLAWMSERSRPVLR